MLTILRFTRSNTSASPMKSSTSSKSNKPQRKHREAADTAVVGAEIAATVVAVGDKVVVAGEEEVGARLKRELERGTFMLSRNDHKQHHDTPGFILLATIGFRDFSVLDDGKDIVWPSGSWYALDLLVREAFCMIAKEPVLL